MTTKNPGISSEKGSRMRGFSLVEVVLAIGVASFAILAILALIPSFLDTSRTSWQDARAAQIARQIFTELRPGAGSSEGLLRATDTGAPVVIDYTAGDFEREIYCAEDGSLVAADDPRAAFEVEIEIEAVDADRPHFRQVRIDVRPIGAESGFQFFSRVGPSVMEDS